jgi:hypothetical protein
VIPYINGQLFDTRIKRWAAENATQWVQKFVDESMLTHDHTPGLNPHIEHFDHIEGAVMCPATKVRLHVRELERVASVCDE